jgi:hypothetical protein
MWRFAAARATGTSHLGSGIPCQDRLHCLVYNESTFIAAVADGAGSAAMADQGAQIVTDTVVQSVCRSISSGRTDFCGLLLEAAGDAREAVVGVATKQGVSVREFASTLLTVVIGPEGGAALQIGDGVIVISDGGDSWSWVFWPQRGEYANTTRFLTDEGASTFIQVETLVANIQDVALMTDGLEFLAVHYASRTAHQPFFNAVFAPLLNTDGGNEITPLSAALEAFLVSPKITTRADDDLTFVMATRRNRSAASECS